MKQLLFVFIGGGFGSVLRYVIGKWFIRSGNTIPFATLFVNVIGSLIIGLVIGYFIKVSDTSNNYVLLLATGFCGGFTTFSTFAYENHIFLKSGDFTSFAYYTIASFVVGFLAVFAGMYIVRFV